MFKTRLLSGIVLVIVTFIMVFIGRELLLAGSFVVSCIGMYELYRVFGVEKSLPALVAYLVTAVFFINLRWDFVPELLMLAILFLILLMFIYVFSFPKFKADQIMTVFFGFFYVAVMLSYIYRLRDLEHGLHLSALIFFCSWGSDTFAYCVGMLIGKHKMSPVLSPKKSVEGAVGGIAGTAAITALYEFLLRGITEVEPFQIAILTAISAVAAFISMIGDLTASAVKRNYGVKDYGKLIPGHGGILDRFDSVIITAPIIYYLAVYFAGF